MADIKKLAPLIARWEGGYVNDTIDRGGATNMGITLGTWRSQGYDKDGDGNIDKDDIKLLDYNDFAVILRIYWNKWVADLIEDQQIANILVDWVWGSGKWGIIIPQRLLGVQQDGIVGKKTLAAVNNRIPYEFHKQIWEARKQFLLDIVKRNPSQKKFINGWLNRLNDFKWK